MLRHHTLSFGHAKRRIIVLNREKMSLIMVTVVSRKMRVVIIIVANCLKNWWLVTVRVERGLLEIVQPVWVVFGAAILSGGRRCWRCSPVLACVKA